MFKILRPAKTHVVKVEFMAALTLILWQSVRIFTYFRNCNTRW